jgi:hypothetical protein
MWNSAQPAVLLFLMMTGCGGDRVAPDGAAEEDASGTEPLTLEVPPCPVLAPPAGGCVERCTHRRTDYSDKLRSFGVGLHPDGTQLAVRAGDGIYVTDLESGHARLVHSSPGLEVLGSEQVRFSSDAAEIWFTGVGIFKVDLATGMEVKTVEYIQDFALAPGGRQLVHGWTIIDLPTSDADYPLTGFEGRELRESAEPNDIDISDGARVAIANRKGTTSVGEFRAFDLAAPTDAPLFELEALNSVAWSDDERHAVVSTTSAAGRDLWLVDADAPDGAPVRLAQCEATDDCAYRLIDVVGQTVVEVGYQVDETIFVLSCDLPTR